jgi:hypothetical protein
VSLQNHKQGRNINNVKLIQTAADNTEIKKEVGEQQLSQHQKDDKCIISSPDWSSLEAGLLGLVEIDFNNFKNLIEYL